MSMPAVLPAPLSTAGCRLVSADGRTLPLREARLTVDARAGLATVVATQRFHNAYAEALTTTFQLPLPPDAAVVGFAFRIGDRRIEGEIARKADARARFEEAVLEGRTAALLEQDRSSLFTQEIGNIPPGTEVVAEVTLEQALAWTGDGWSWRFPTVVAPRFLGASTPDPGRVSVDVADGPMPATAQLALSIGDACSGPAHSPTHVIDAVGGAVSLARGAALDRDIAVHWPVAAPQPGVAVELARPSGDADAYARVVVVPPHSATPSAPVPRDLILLLDTSGSMGGRPLDQAKAFSRALVQTLAPHDRLELISFSSQPRRWRSAPAAMDAHARADALRWLAALQAGGGTWMHEAIVEALRPLRDGAQRQVVLVSDGLIGFEDQVLGAIIHGLPLDSRVHTVGVGSGVNRSLTAPAARAGGGVEVVVGLDEPVEPALQRLLARTDRPLVVDVTVSGAALLDHAPLRVPDLFSGAPLALALRVRPEGGAVVLSGRGPEGAWSHALSIAPSPEGSGRRVVSTRYARERVEDLEARRAIGAVVDADVERLGLQHRISTRLTSWVAATPEATVDPANPTRREQVPQALPYGMSAEGVGLRGAAPPPAPAMPALSISTPAPAQAPRRRAQERRVKKKAEADKGGGFLRALFKSGPAGPPPAPPADRRDEEVEGFSLDDAHEVEESLVPPPPASGRARGLEGLGRALRALRARVVLRRGGRLVLELELDADLSWSPGSEVTARFADGRTRVLSVTRPTTRAGAATRGQILRLSVFLDDGEALPTSVFASGLELRVEG